VWLRKELASRSKFGQDLAAPAACQRHLSPQPVPSRAIQCLGRAVSQGPRSQPSSGGTCVSVGSTPRGSSACRAAQGMGSSNGGGFMPKKPTAGMADPRRSAQTLFPFYLGKHETAEPQGQAAPCQQLQQRPAPSRTPRDGQPTRTQRCLLLAEPLGAHPAGNPTSPRLAAHRHRLHRSTPAHCCDECLRSQFE